MRFLLRRLVVLLVALAFIAGGMSGVAAPIAIAADPCMQEHAVEHDHTGQTSRQTPQKQESTRTCQQCCLGICVSMPNLPTAMTTEPVAVTPVAYWDTAGFAVGRSITPEPGPPRPLA